MASPATIPLRSTVSAAGAVVLQGRIALTDGPEAEAPALGDGPGLVAVDPAMRRLLQQAERVAASKATVLIEGETGTGKELLARLIHRASPRASQPFIRVNCAALSEGLIESEFFGHERGSFTGAEQTRPGRFELADGGTLLLDEVSETSQRVQAKLLRVLEEEEFERVGGTRTLSVDVRVVATTNRCLEAEAARGEFRRDLYYRLGVVTLAVPPLRARPDDIAALAQHFFERFRREAARPLEKLASATLKTLKGYDWPGNVRQLRNVLQRACLLADGPEVLPEHLPPLDGTDRAGPAGWAGRTLEEIERHVILTTLREMNGNRTATARRLGITTRTLQNKLNRYRADGACGG